MAENNLVQLAERFLRLSAELDGVRRGMLTALTNGAGETRPGPFAPAGRASAKGARHPAAIAAAEAEARIAELVRDRPGLRTSEIAKETRAKVNTTVERLKRMTVKGLVERQDASGGWRVSATTGSPPA